MGFIRKPRCGKAKSKNTVYSRHQGLQRASHLTKKYLRLVDALEGLEVRRYLHRVRVCSIPLEIPPPKAFGWCVVLLRRHSGKVWVPGLHAKLDRVLSTPPLFRLRPGLGAAATGCRPEIGKRSGILGQSLPRSIRRGVQVSLPVVRASPGVSQLTIPLSKV